MWWPWRRKRVLCPACGSRDQVPIVYGLPTDATVRRAGKGEVALGGCMVSSDSPDWHCRNCGTEWIESGERAKGS